MRLPVVSESASIGSEAGLEAVCALDAGCHWVSTLDVSLAGGLGSLRPAGQDAEAEPGVAALGGGFLIFTDKEPAVLQLTKRTAERNGAQGDVVAYDFAQPSPFRQGFDLLLAADVLFLDQLAVPLFTAFDRAQPAVGILGHEIRRAVFKGPDGQPCRWALAPETCPVRPRAR